MKYYAYGLLIVGLAFSVSRCYAARFDGSELPACKGVTDVCMAANVSSVDSKTGKTIMGYIAGEHVRTGKGLWADCVQPLSKGKSVEGVSGVSKEAALACHKAKEAAHPEKK